MFHIVKINKLLIASQSQSNQNARFGNRFYSTVKIAFIVFVAQYSTCYTALSWVSPESAFSSVVGDTFIFVMPDLGLAPFGLA